MSKHTTVADVLTHLEDPAHADEIQYLAHLRNLEKLSHLKQIPGVGGLVSRFTMWAVGNHMEALMMLAECKTPADITAFKQTKHYNKVKKINLGIDGDFSLKGLEGLKDLDDLEELRTKH